MGGRFFKDLKKVEKPGRGEEKINDKHFLPFLKSGEVEILPWRGEGRGKSQRITGPKRDRSVTKMKIRFVKDLVKRRSVTKRK